MIDFRLCLITDGVSLMTGERISQACRAGVRMVQLRAKTLEARSLHETAVELRRVTAEHGSSLLINERYDVARAVEAEGVHMPEGSYPPYAVRQEWKRDITLGVSTHSLDRIRRAEDEGADYVFYGPIFDTPSKRRYGRPLGLEALSNVCKEARVPIFAIGGIKADNAPLCMKAGAHGVAVISAIMEADDIAGAVHEFEEGLRGL